MASPLPPPPPLPPPLLPPSLRPPVLRSFGRRRLLRVLSPLALLALLAAGCARVAAPPPARELNVWTLDLAPRFTPYMRRVIAAWERRHPGVTVRWTDVPWSSVELALKNLSSSAPLV